MKRLTFWQLCGGLTLALAGCAESAIPSDLDPADDDSTDSSGETDDLDAATTDSSLTEDASTRRPDASTRDASDASDPSKGDAGPSLDSGKSDAGTDASARDAGRDASTPDAGSDAGGGGTLSCSNGQTTCGNLCVNTQTDIKNCGGCGNVCASGQSCQNNQCTGGAPDFNVPAGCSKKTYGSHGYAFCVNNLSWTDARNACLDAKLDLAIVTDQGENDFVKANGDSWIATNDRIDEGKYVQVVPGNRNNVNGAQANYFNWRSGEPNNTTKCDGFTIPFISTCLGARTEEDCVMIYGSDGQWNDGDCGQSHSYVCETY